MMPHTHPQFPYSRDHGLSETIRCQCQPCVANVNGYCVAPSLIQISPNGECQTGQRYLDYQKNIRNSTTHKS